MISACLLGLKTKYDGGSNPIKILCDLKDSGIFLPVCPECSGGLQIPHLPAEIQDGDGFKVLAGEAAVKNSQGLDVTSFFLAGAEKILQIALAKKIKVAIFKESSPSCGVHKIYDGSFQHHKIKGIGVCAALLQQHGITLYSEDDISLRFLQEISGIRK